MSDPLDVDVNELSPHQMARLLVSRAMPPRDHMCWAEIHWDANRYRQTATMVVHLVGMVEQLIDLLAEHEGVDGADLWRTWMVNEAVEDAN